MNAFCAPGICATVMAFSLAACSAGSDGSGDSGTDGNPGLPTGPADEVVDIAYSVVSDRSADGTANMAYVFLVGQTTSTSDAVTITFSTGDIVGELLTGTNIDSAEFSNPANGEFSRVVGISGSSLFGAVGLEVLLNDDLPETGTVTNYNEGWVGMTAAFEENVYVLEGDATFTTTWGSGDIDGWFFNLSGTDQSDADVTNVGTIALIDANVVDDSFSGGRVTGTGVFSSLDSTSSTAGTSGTFFGPQADELGGVLVINDVDDDILVFGAFQAD